MDILYAASSDLELSNGGSIAAAGREVSSATLRLSSSASGNVFSRWRSKLRSMSYWEWAEILLPCSQWIRNYRYRDCLGMDVVAGITVGVMLVPQAMSYAKLAGLHPIYGLYSGFVPIFVYAVFGSSRQAAIGPVTLVSLIVSDTLSGIAEPSSDLYVELAILLAFMVGVLECAMGLLRVGWLLRFVSHAVFSGCITSSAIVIALSQAKYFLGYNIERSNNIVPLAKSIIAGAGKFSWPPFLLGSSILAVIILLKHLGKTKKNLRFLRASGPLVAVILGTTFVKLFHPSSISVVGEVPQGFPRFRIPTGFQHAKSLMSTAVLITGVAILESLGIAKALAAKNGYELDSNQELLGLGMANVFGSFFSAYPATGSFTRSTLNHESGAQTGLAGVTMGVTVGCALYFLTPLFRDIPQCALAAIVFSVGISLLEYDEAMFLWRTDKKDFFLWTITCIITLFLGIEFGVLIGMFFSLAFVIHESANPCVGIMGRLPGTTLYRNIEQYPEAYVYHGIVMIQINSPMYFANISYIKDRIRQHVLNISRLSNLQRDAERIHFLIIEMASVPYIDSSAVEALKDLHQAYKCQEIQIAISNPNQKVLTALMRSGLVELIGNSWYFACMHDSVITCLQQMPDSISKPPRDGYAAMTKETNYFRSHLKQQHGEEYDIDQEPLLQ